MSMCFFSAEGSEAITDCQFTQNDFQTLGSKTVALQDFDGSYIIAQTEMRILVAISAQLSDLISGHACRRTGAYSVWVWLTVFFIHHFFDYQNLFTPGGRPILLTLTFMCQCISGWITCEIAYTKLHKVTKAICIDLSVLWSCHAAFFTFPCVVTRHSSLQR